MITISTHAPRMIPSEHLSRQRAGMNGIFDHYRAVDQNGGAASAPDIDADRDSVFSTSRKQFRPRSDVCSVNKSRLDTDVADWSVHGPEAGISPAEIPQRNSLPASRAA